MEENAGTKTGNCVMAENLGLDIRSLWRSGLDTVTLMNESQISAKLIAASSYTK